MDFTAVKLCCLQGLFIAGACPRCWLRKGWVLFLSGFNLLVVRNSVVATVHLPDVLVKGHGCDMLLRRTKAQVIVVFMWQCVVCWDSSLECWPALLEGQNSEWRRFFKRASVYVSPKTLSNS